MSTTLASPAHPDPACHLEPLSELALAILDFEARWWQHPQSKDRQIRAVFDMTSVRYYQLLNRLIDLPAARAEAPLTVLRLRRLRTRRLHESARGA